MGEKRNACRISVENQNERDQKEGLDIGGRIILKLISVRIGWYLLDLSGSGCGQ
jgi:hypothetical protein